MLAFFLKWSTCTCRYPSLKTVRELVYKRGYGKVNGDRIRLTNNTIVEQKLARFGMMCVEDLVHEIYTVGRHFKEAANFLWPFQLKAPKGGFKKVTNGFVEKGDFGNREHFINSLVSSML